MKKIKKIIILSIYVILVISLFSTTFASVTEHFKGEITGTAESGKTSIIKIVSSVLTVVRIIGSGVAVSILIVIACKYIVASAGDRADIKKYAVNYVLGALVLFGASGIASILKKFTDASVGG